MRIRIIWNKAKEVKLILGVASSLINTIKFYLNIIIKFDKNPSKPVFYLDFLLK